MSFNELLTLVSDTANGQDNLDKAAIGFSNYGFVFKDEKKTKESYVITSYSSKFADVGSYHGITEKALKLDEINILDELVRYDEKYDCLFAGSLKTLLPSLEFGGDEILFYVWVFVKTPEGKQFPMTFYFGPSGTSLGGLGMKEYKDYFPKVFTQIINWSPFDFSKDGIEGLIEALEYALKKTPVSDFYAVYKHDFGNALMDVREGNPFIKEIGREYDETDIKFYLEEVEYSKERFD
ncbi:hypothetical protein LCGC14_1647800 [marine sediment metagenome]|uniref:Uncharacterized protein n=1 Tax=marine sediment metagenome TaxID=412755 RepID=A0A0F9HXP7_9ZZZZ|nr:hypothetical protein [bacterium]